MVYLKNPLLALLTVLAEVSASGNRAPTRNYNFLRTRVSRDVSSSRKLTYACSSRESGSGRYLMHPCNNRHPTTSQYYNKNTNSEDSDFFSIFMGVVVGVAALAGFFFFVDKERFDEVTKAAGCTCTCRKPRVDPDDIEDINDIDDQFVTPETAIHLQELKDEEEKPFRILRSMMFWKHAKDYDENDKYKLHEPTPIEKEVNDKIDTIWDRLHNVWLTITWRRAKSYDQTPDKYVVPGMTPSQEEIKYDSSYESNAESVPWQ
mmetsp:Transcript_1130/g.2314  ORF Transcript_1130/g.2314 Transcript_1130/m.2314 type:complete len:262 (-) Transcript_1130:843-1628(-)